MAGYFLEQISLAGNRRDPTHLFVTRRYDICSVSYRSRRSRFDRTRRWRGGL